MKHPLASVVLLMTAAAACSWSTSAPPPAPAVVAVVPTQAPNHLPSTLQLEALNLEPSVTVDFDDPGQSTVAADLAVTLVAGDVRIPLADVRFVEPSVLEATIPSGAPAGTYDVELRDARDRLSLLPAAFTLFVPDPECVAELDPCDDGDACTQADACTGWRCLGAAVTCTASDACHAAGTCDPASGLCSTPAVPDGTPCFVSCAEGDTCQSGTCTPPPGGCDPPDPDEVTVTTSLDERDAGATPSAPGGTGLSLREAIAWVNLQPIPKTITMAAPMTIVMTGSQRDLSLTAAGAAIVAEPGVTLDFAGLNQACLKLDGPGQRLDGATLTGCDAVFVYMTNRSRGSQVAHLTIAESSRTAIGVEAQSSSLPVSRIGPGNDLSGLATALDVQGTDYEVFDNRLHGNAVGAKLFGLPARVFRNVFFGQLGAPPLAGIGLRAYVGDGPVEILHNVFDRNAAHGLQADAISSLTIRDNLFTGNGGYGVSAVAAGLALDHNGYFANLGGAVLPGLTTGATDLLVDPLYVDGSGGDYGLLPLSPGIDAGVDTGLDVNGTAAGLYNGAAPDLGAFEAP